MEMPPVVHPKKIDIDGFIFEVTAYVSLTDQQAGKIANAHYRNMKPKPKKKDRGKFVYRVVSLVDERSVEFL